MMKKKQHIIRLDRDTEDYILPKDFFDIFVRRFLPVISLTYLISIIGVAGSKGDFIYYIFKDQIAYVLSVFVVLWVSGPAIIWIVLNGSPLFKHVADLWYKILAFIMIVTISLSHFLFPEADIYGLKVYFVSSIPVFILIYIFFVKEWLPEFLSYPLNVLGFCALIYGAVISVIF